MAQKESVPSARAEHLHVHADSGGDNVRHVHGFSAVVFQIRATRPGNTPEAGMMRQLIDSESEHKTKSHSHSLSFVSAHGQTSLYIL